MTLSDFFAEKKRLAIAFSGGLDSRFLCASALKANCDVLAIHIRGPHIPRGESAGARAFAATMELSLEEVAVDPLSVPQIANTDPLRCYYYILARRRGYSVTEAMQTICPVTVPD